MPPETSHDGSGMLSTLVERDLTGSHCNDFVGASDCLIAASGMTAAAQGSRGICGGSAVMGAIRAE